MVTKRVPRLLTFYGVDREKKMIVMNDCEGKSKRTMREIRERMMIVVMMVSIRAWHQVVTGQFQ